jgi:predicted benzoate:H+ symporter BenE
LLLALGAAILFTFRKAQKDNQKVWDLRTKRLIINLIIPLATGGILSLMMLLKGFIGLVAPFTLIFYGLALINASRYTLHEIRSLGLVEIVIGLLGVAFVKVGLIFWALGFGIIHIIYGLYMQRKYGS